jgi:hypothetical protein
MNIAAMHSEQNKTRVHRLNMFSLVYGRRQAVLIQTNIQQTAGQGEPKMTTCGIFLLEFTFSEFFCVQKRSFFINCFH